MRQSALDKKIKKPGLKLNPWVGPWFQLGPARKGQYDNFSLNNFSIDI